MEPRKLLEILDVAERLKDATRHCYTRNGRHESVAEHSWMMTLMAFFLREEFPDVDMDKVIEMCIIHDLGEAFTGDIPTFDKTDADEAKEEALLYGWVKSLPEPFAEKMLALYDEMAKRETKEAKVYKAIDGLEALVQHNISDLSTWIPKEYELNNTMFFQKNTNGKWLVMEATNIDVQQRQEQVLLTFMNGDEVLSSEFVDAHAGSVKLPTITAPEGKVFTGWYVKEVGENGTTTAHVIFTPDENGHVGCGMGKAV